MSRYHVHPTYHENIRRNIEDEWRQRATNECQALADILGTVEYAKWAERTWPGESIKNQSYKAICEVAHAAIEALETCTCKPDGDTCPACRAYLRTRYPESAEDEHLEDAYELRYEGYDDSYPY